MLRIRGENNVSDTSPPPFVELRVRYPRAQCGFPPIS